MSNRESLQSAKHFLCVSIIAGLFAPFVASAQSIDAIMDKVLSWLTLLLPLFSSLAVVYFFIGIVRYMNHAADEKTRDEGKSIMIWGMIALFVMVALWGLVGYLQVSLGLNQSGGAGNAPHTPLGPLPTFK